MDILKKELENIKEEISSDFCELLDGNALKHFLLGSSKYIRSTISLLYLKSLNQEINSDIIKVLAIGEIMHNASLLHDDVIDDAQTRRGKSTIANRFTSKISVLSGDYLLLYTMKKLLELDISEISDNFRDCAEKMIKAEIRQYFLRNSYVSKEEYLKICEYKTALLFSTILKCCALILKLDIENASNFGKIFGIIFQINNDLDELSAKQDKINGISTAQDILGIENTRILLDNYLGELNLILEKLPDNIYKIRLEDLIKQYVR